MVPRQKTPQGKTVTLCAKISETDAGLIDARCAALGITRSAWLQSLVAADLSGVTDGGSVHGISLRVDPQMPRGVAALVSPGRPPVLMGRPSAADCPHPKARVHKGLCGACGTNVS